MVQKSVEKVKILSFGIDAAYTKKGRKPVWFPTLF